MKEIKSANDLIELGLRLKRIGVPEDFVATVLVDKDLFQKLYKEINDTHLAICHSYKFDYGTKDKRYLEMFKFLGIEFMFIEKEEK